MMISAIGVRGPGREGTPHRLIIDFVDPPFGGWKIYKFNQIDWKDSDIREYLEGFQEHYRGKYNFNDPESWYSIPQVDFTSFYGSGLISSLRSHIDLITKFIAPRRGGGNDGSLISQIGETLRLSKRFGRISKQRTARSTVFRLLKIGTRSVLRISELTEVTS